MFLLDNAVPTSPNGGNQYLDGTYGKTYGIAVIYDIINKLVYFGGRTNCIDLPVTAEDDFPQNDFIGDPLVNWFDSPKGYIVKLDDAGFKIYATYFGSDGQVNNLDINKEGHLFAVGTSLRGLTNDELESNNNNFYQDSDDDGKAFIAEFDLNSVLTWSTKFGETDWPTIIGLDIDNDDNLIVAGYAAGFVPDPLLDFVDPGGNALYITANQGGNDSGIGETFIAKFEITENSRDLIWSTLFSGSSEEYGYEVGTNSNNEIYYVGISASSTLPSSLNSNSGCGDLFVAKFSENGESLGTRFIGGSENDGSWGQCYPNSSYIGFFDFNNKVGLTFDDLDNIYISALTNSDDLSTLELNGAYFQDVMGNNSMESDRGDALIISLNKDLDLRWITYFGGRSGQPSNDINWEDGTGLAVLNDRLFLAGTTTSKCTKKIPIKDASPLSNYFYDELNLGEPYPYPSYSSDGFITVFDLSNVIVSVKNEYTEQNNDIFVYPLPADEILYLSVPETSLVSKIVISDLLGRVVYSTGRTDSNEIAIPTKLLLSGIYIVSIFENDKFSSKKVVINHN